MTRDLLRATRARRRRGPEGFGEAPQASTSGAAAPLTAERIRSTLAEAREAGMLDAKTARISGRISPALITQAKARTGIASDSELIEFALASVALDDDFAAVFERVKGTIDPDLPLGF